MSEDPNKPLPEFGSMMHLFYPERAGVEEPMPFARGLLFGNGRQALLALYAARLLPAGRLWVPDYFCPEVLASWETFVGEIRTYPFGPWSKELKIADIPAQDGDTVLLLNTLGLFGQPDLGSLQQRGVMVVEDHSHDPFSPWATASNADWCVASLRKSLPLPDGGVLWSPAGHRLPEAPTLSAAHELAAGRVFAAMALKRDYLFGGFPPKSLFRQLYLEGDAGVIATTLSSITPTTKGLLARFPHAAWRRQRQANWQRLAQAWDGVGVLRVATPKHSEAVPFGVVLLLPDQSSRNRLRAALQAAQFYTAILWELASVQGAAPGAESRAFSQRHLVVACDGRYREVDLEAMTRLVLEEAGRL